MSNTQRFDQKVAIVTGGASGIGAATVRRLHGEGASVMIVDMNEESAQKLVASLGERADFCIADVSQIDQVDAMVGRTVARFGRLDILFNNAGISCYGRTHKLEPDAWRKVVEVNLNSIFYCCRAALPGMMANGGGGHYQYSVHFRAWRRLRLFSLHRDKRCRCQLHARTGA